MHKLHKNVALSMGSGAFAIKIIRILHLIYMYKYIMYKKDIYIIYLKLLYNTAL